MTLDLAGLSVRNVPVLCIDTCSILDIVRNPTRGKLRAQDFQAAIEVIAAAGRHDLVILIAEQVMVELTQRLQGIKDETDQEIDRIIDRVYGASSISAVFGSPGTVDLSHLKGHAERAGAYVNSLLATSTTIIPCQNAGGLAFARMNARIAPARQGKDSSKDCLIFETYLEALQTLRQNGLTSPAALLSSNTDDYDRQASITEELAALSATYQPNMSAAKYALRI